MKRFLTLVLLLLAIVSLYALTGAGGMGGEERRLFQIGRALGVDLSDGMLVQYEDSHGGFHGDGLTTAEVEVDGLEEGLAGVLGWKPLPMSGNAVSALRLLGGTGARQGWYYLYDRHSESRDPYDDTELCSRYSYNFTMAVYDSGQRRLYFYELDT